jgi:hypothetical protein
MPPSIDEEYLTWLYARIGSVRETRRSKTYWSLFRFLFHKEFIWLIPNDDNRVEDGRYLRYEFLEETGLGSEISPDWMGMGCSVLEMLLALSERLAFQADRTPRHWFWELMNNLSLSGYNDRVFDEERVNTIVDTLIWRTYKPNGLGGLFPLRHPKEDQREVEIWYQLSAYLLESD